MHDTTQHHVSTTWVIRSTGGSEPPGPLAGGYTVGEQIYYAGASQTFESGDRVEHRQQGEVVGPGSLAHKGKGVKVLFSGNKYSISCHTAEMEVARKCRVCYGENGPLVQPCACRGSAKWTHEHCLEEWRRTSVKEDAAYRCGQCMDKYRDALSLELLRERLQTQRTNGDLQAHTLNVLAEELQAQGHYGAEPLYREALQVTREKLGGWHQHTLASMGNLATTLAMQGDLAAAEPLIREVLEVMRETLGSRHPDTLNSINNLGQLLQDKGDLAAAELLQREAVETARETLGNRHPSTLTCLDNLGVLLEAKGDFAAAESLIREALEVQRATLGSRNPSTLSTMTHLGSLLHRKGDLAAAEPLLGEALEASRETLGDSHPITRTCFKEYKHCLEPSTAVALTIAAVAIAAVAAAVAVVATVVARVARVAAASISPRV